MKFLCENIQGCVLGYTQSDEITIVLVDYKNLDSQSWFDNEVQKICSIAASMATMAFNKFFYHVIAKQSKRLYTEYLEEQDSTYIENLERAMNKGAMFDARCFNIPKEGVTNNIYWRQLDATRNSIQMVGQSNFSHKELQNRSCNQIQDMLFTQKGINWNDIPTHLKRGSCCIKEKYFVEGDGKEIAYPEGCSDPYEDDEMKYGVWKSRWVVDEEIPIFKGEGREYIDRLVYIGE